MKRTIFLFVVMALTFCVQAGWNGWTNSSGDGLWSTQANWSYDLSDTGQQPSIGHWNGDEITECVADVTANNSGYSIISIGNGSSVGSSTAHGTGRLKVTGATLSATTLWAANNPYDYAELIMDSGSMTFDGVRIGIKGRAIVTINGGTLTVNSTFHIPYDSTNTKQNQLHINGGMVLFDSADGYFMLRDGSFVNIAGGTLKVKSNGVNTVTTFENYAASGRLKAYNDAPGAELSIVEESGYIVITATAGIVLTPGWVPWDGGGSDSLWTTGANWRSDPAQNTWPDNTMPDIGCNASIGYFSATENDVAEITASMDISINGIAIGIGVNNTPSIGTLNMYGGTLSASYIRLASNGTTTATINREACQGDFNVYGGVVNVENGIEVAREGLGRMTVEGGNITAKSLLLASKPTGVGTLTLKGGTVTINYVTPTSNNFNIDNASIIDVWGGELKYNVGGKYLLSDFEAFAAAGKIIAYSNDPRAQLNIETVGDYIVINSDIQDTIAGFPTPENGAVIADPNAVLSWTAGTEAVSHNVYFSDSLEDVENAVDTSSPFCIAAGISQPQLDVDNLLLGTTYYWRVDEVDASSQVVTGFVWSFTRVDYVAVETFDTYTDYLSLLANGWSEEGGSYVDVVGDEATVQGGTKSMFIDCYNSSAMTKTFTPVQNWSSSNNDVSLLQVYVKGKEANNLTSASVILTDSANQTATVNFDNISKLMPADYYSDLWTRWLIPLADFGAANAKFDISQVKKMSLSFDMVGSGSIYVDSIYLILSGCYLDHYPVGDMTGDCVIDIDDFALFGRDWLKSEPVVPTVTPVVWYQFDETSGSDAADNSGNGYTATAKAAGAAATAVWSDQGKIGGCIEFDGTYCMKFSGSELSAITDEVTVSLWINGDPELQPGACITFAATDTPMATQKQLNAHLPWSSGYVYFDTAGNTTYDRTSWFAPAEAYKYGWNHYAFTKNTQTGEQKIYHNGNLVAVTTGKTMQMDIAEMSIGMATNEISTPYFGRVDDFRVYNVELTADEILAISGYPRNGDFAGDDNFVNQADLEAVMANWLSEVLWPVQ